MKIVSFICVLGVFIFGVSNPAIALNYDEKRLSLDLIETTVVQVSEALDKSYVYPKVALEMNAYLRQQLQAGSYKDSRTHRELIKDIQANLRQISNDGHISLLLAEDSVDRNTIVVPLTESQSKIHAEMVSSDVTGTIGYLQIDTFNGNKKTKDKLIKAMDSVANSDALIIDLRKNEGGDPNIVALLSSYFVEDETRLWSIVDRSGEQVIEVRSKKNESKFTGDLYILTSHKTYSAAEAFAYTLKHAKRAIIVGENTGGGAHLVEMMRVNDDIDMRVPVARAYNHITESNWERVGVIPDFIVNATDAKTAAIKRINNETRK